MQPQAIRFFTDSAGALLLAAAVALVISIFGADAHLVWPHDSVLIISLRTLYWIFAGLASGMALVCLFGRRAGFKTALIFWLMLNVTAYALAVHWNGHGGSISAYWNSLAAAFGITPGAAYFLLAMLFFYLSIGSSVSLAWLWMDKSKTQREGLLKMSCQACGGHVKFAPQNLGQLIPCPHCQATITLRKPENLKMSCHFCKEHIAFPSHALGQKIKCPHCTRDITLTEPA
jgi:uncharacterized paraquat-inducible protein A